MNAIAKLPSNVVSPLTGIPVGYGPGGPLPTPTQWIQNGTFLQWSGGIVVGNPPGSGMGPGSVNASSFFVNGQPFDLGNYLPLSGGIVGGPLTVNGLLTVIGGNTGITIDEGTF